MKAIHPQPKRITIGEKTFCINDLKAEEIVCCISCNKTDRAEGNFVLQVERKDEKEDFYCFNCWREKSKTTSWVGIFCLIVFAENCFRSLEAGEIVNKAFGSPFDAIRSAPGGFVLYSNSVKVEQLNLFG